MSQAHDARPFGLALLQSHPEGQSLPLTTTSHLDIQLLSRASQQLALPRHLHLASLTLLLPRLS